MEIYRIPRRLVAVRMLLIDGRTLDGTLFTSESGPGGRPEDVLHLLNESNEDFVPLAIGDDSFVLNKAGILWVQLAAELEWEVVDEAKAALHAPVRLTLAGGIGIAGTLAIVMPPERRRVLDYLNAAGRFFPVLGEGTVTLVQRRFVVSVRSDEEDARA